MTDHVSHEFRWSYDRYFDPNGVIRGTTTAERFGVGNGGSSPTLNPGSQIRFKILLLTHFGGVTLRTMCQRAWGVVRGSVCVPLTRREQRPHRLPWSPRGRNPGRVKYGKGGKTVVWRRKRQ